MKVKWTITVGQSIEKWKLIHTKMKPNHFRHLCCVCDRIKKSKSCTLDINLLWHRPRLRLPICWYSYLVQVSSVLLVLARLPMILWTKMQPIKFFAIGKNVLNIVWVSFLVWAHYHRYCLDFFDDSIQNYSLKLFGRFAVDHAYILSTFFILWIRATYPNHPFLLLNNLLE